MNKQLVPNKTFDVPMHPYAGIIRIRFLGYYLSL
jgi:hypothetical protein